MLRRRPGASGTPSGKSVIPLPHTRNMSKQLRLIEPSNGWRLDAETREIGRKGIADARAALRNSHPRYAAPTTKAA